MLPLLQELVRHKWYANASLITAIQEHEPAARDEELRKLLHHILLANRFWLMLTLAQSFQIEAESRVPEALHEVIARYKRTCELEMEWIFHCGERDLARRLESPFFQGQTFSVADGVMQIVMHSHGHRAQCSTRLRAMGGEPPNMDYVRWLKDRPAAEWHFPYTKKQQNH